MIADELKKKSHKKLIVLRKFTNLYWTAFKADLGRMRPTQAMCWTSLFYTIFYCTFSMFRYTNIYHCVSIAYSIQCSNMLYRVVA